MSKRGLVARILRKSLVKVFLGVCLFITLWNVTRVITWMEGAAADEPSTAEDDHLLRNQKFWDAPVEDSYLTQMVGEGSDDVFDHLYVINLRHREDRFEQMKNRLTKLDYRGNTTFFHAPIDYTKGLGFNSPRPLYTNDPFLAMPRNLGYASSWEAHRGVCRHALYMNFTQILVLEDDVETRFSSLDLVRQAVTALQNKAWARIMLGYDAQLFYPGPLDVPLNLVRTEAFAIHAYVANVSEYCTQMFLTPYDRRDKRKFPQKYQAKTFMWLLEEVCANVRIWVFRWLKPSYRGPPSFLLDFYLSRRLSYGSFAMFPRFAIQVDMKSDLRGISNFFRGSTPASLWYFSVLTQPSGFYPYVILFFVGWLLMKGIRCLLYQLFPKSVRKSV